MRHPKPNKCLLCGELFKQGKGNYLFVHLRKTHLVSRKEYYDKFYRTEEDAFCKECRNPTQWGDGEFKYLDFCSINCRNVKLWEIEGRKTQQAEVMRKAMSGEKQSKRLQKLWTIPEYRAEHEAYLNDPITIEKNSNTMKEHWRDPTSSYRTSPKMHFHLKTIHIKFPYLREVRRKNMEYVNTVEYKSHYRSKNGTELTFRSKNERSFAILLDNIEIEWIYEPFQLKKYKPDFFISLGSKFCFLELHDPKDMNKHRIVNNSELDVIWFHPKDIRLALKKFHEHTSYQKVESDEPNYIYSTIQENEDKVYSGTTTERDGV